MKRNDRYFEQLSAFKQMTDLRLDHHMQGERLPQERLREAMRYSLLDGGKRLRAILTLEFCRVSGKSPETALDFACGIEMLHAYSLIHDDLPCMDDDDYRRGRLSNHKAFGEQLALLAGDALQAEAFSTVLRSGLPAENVVIAAGVLGNAAGY
jgi:geranylgeranyl diphosphate synthase type II